MGKKLKSFMIKKSLLLSLFLLAIQEGFTQAKEDVLYLKNQNVIRGAIIEKNDSTLKIRTADGSVYNYKRNDIDSVTREKLYNNFMYKTSGFSNYTELGALIAGKTTIEGVTT